jgi:hypothetical protein
MQPQGASERGVIRPQRQIQITWDEELEVDKGFVVLERTDIILYIVRRENSSRKDLTTGSV